jgi:hypothetical protein
VSAFERLYLGTEGAVPSLAGATSWLNTDPLTPEALRGRVVAFHFCTYTCINWLRTLPYVRAWAEKYAAQGLVVVGVHTPEFPFERDLDNIRPQLAGRGVEYPVAVDSDYGVWQAFDNHYWPALYLADLDGRIRYHHFGEGAYEESERAIQALLREAGADGVSEELVSAEPLGDELSAVWEDVRSPETYLGSEQGASFASPSGPEPDRRRSYDVPSRLALNQWALSGEWTLGRGLAQVDEAGGRLAFRFHARDVNLIMGSGEPGRSVGFRVTIDGQEPGASHGIDVDERGVGTVGVPRMYQVVRASGPVAERTFEIELAEAGVGAYCFTFG